MQVRGDDGQWYCPDPGQWDALTRLRDSAAKVEAESGLVVVVVRSRMRVRLGPLTVRVLAWTITVGDSVDRPCESGWARVRTAKSAADVIRGIGLGARVRTGKAKRHRGEDDPMDHIGTP
jgi:hypothetical protein